MDTLIQTEVSRYSVGQGSQAGILRAQLEHTKLLRETTMHEQEMGQLEATLKSLLHRSQDSGDDIVPGSVTADCTVSPSAGNDKSCRQPELHSDGRSRHGCSAGCPLAISEARDEAGLHSWLHVPADRKVSRRFCDYYVAIRSMRPIPAQKTRGR